MRTLSAWESMEQHSIYNCDSELTDMEFTPIQERYLGETFRATPFERQFDASEGDYWSPTEQVFIHNLESLNSDILDKLREDTPLSRRWEHLEMFRTLIDSAKSSSHLGYIGSLAFKAIEASKITFQNEDGEIIKDIPVLYPKGQLKAFWKGYNLKKAQLSKASNSAITEIEDLLATELTVQELKTLKQEIYKVKLSYSNKKALWAQCDTRIASIA
jgi:hypothetical protein